METWKTIVDFPDYMISNQGRVKSLKFRKDIILTPWTNYDGYLCIKLWKNKKPCNKLVHRLVLENFDPRENSNDLQCNHINGIKSDNIFSQNIEWCTQSENIKHAFKIGLMSNKGKNHPMYGKHPLEETRKSMSEKQKGENNPNSILTEEKVIGIKQDLNKGFLTNKEIAKKFGVSCKTISSIKTRRTWKHIKE